MGQYPEFIWVVLTLRRKKGRKERNRNTWVFQPKLSLSSRLPPTPNQLQTPGECYLYQKADFHQHRSILWVHLQLLLPLSCHTDHLLFILPTLGPWLSAFPLLECSRLSWRAAQVPSLQERHPGSRSFPVPWNSIPPG